MNQITFADFAFVEPIRLALQNENYTTPTPIQAQAIPHLLEGRDLIGCAQTGTGKTAAFALPILNRLALSKKTALPRKPRVLVLAPTRELAVQIEQSFLTYGRGLNLRQTVVVGGVGYTPQVRALARGVDILVATPGRLLDLMGQGAVRLDGLETFVLDEADRMLDMGFLPAIEKIVAVLPKQRHSLFFSATMPPALMPLVQSLLHDPVKVEVAPQSTTADRVDHRVMYVSRDNKRSLLTSVLSDKSVKRALVFSRTKHGADKIAKWLDQAGISSDAIHGNKSQTARQRALYGFRDGQTRVLVATDIAARGIDIDNITHVINFDLPMEPENYVHRIGRTARAGAEGIALTFCDAEERGLLRSIERIIKQQIPVVEDHPHRMNLAGLPPASGKPQLRGAGRFGGDARSTRRPARGATSSTGHPAPRGDAPSEGRSTAQRQAKTGAVGFKFRSRREP